MLIVREIKDQLLDVATEYPTDSGIILDEIQNAPILLS